VRYEPSLPGSLPGTIAIAATRPTETALAKERRREEGLLMTDATSGVTGSHWFWVK
jgi:hypothetical protein